MARLAWIASELGFRNRLSEGNRHTEEASTRRGSGVLAGRCVLYPPHSTPLLFPDGQCLPNWLTPGFSAIRKPTLEMARIVLIAVRNDRSPVAGSCFYPAFIRL